MTTRTSFGSTSSDLLSWLWTCLVLVIVLGFFMVSMAKTQGSSTIETRQRVTRKKKVKGKAIDGDDGESEDHEGPKSRKLQRATHESTIIERIPTFDPEARILRTNVRGCIIQVTPDSIVEYLGYIRPSASEVDCRHYEFTAKSLPVYMCIMCEDASMFDGEFSLGSLIVERLFEALLPSEALPVVPPSTLTSRATSLGMLLQPFQHHFPNFMPESEYAIQEIGSSEEEEAEVGFDDKEEDNFGFE
ncbi:unnamed protein product [Ilex paraguariensis]|uniref:Uncharacterized protein n=1 Tax=Ilex paraguariensis TaxID=185542 RepID=A0ABC8RE55_9AQUA